MESISAPTDKKTIVPSNDILDGHYFCRSQVETNEEFEMHLNTDDLSMYIQLLGNRNNFDWLIKDSNAAKVIDGNYDDSKRSCSTPKPSQPDYSDTSRYTNIRME